MKITCDDWREFAEIEFKHWQNTEERRKQCLYNALLISKAPEMLKMLKELVKSADDMFNNGEPSETYYQLINKAEKLIKEATEL